MRKKEEKVVVKIDNVTFPSKPVFYDLVDDLYISKRVGPPVSDNMVCWQGLQSPPHETKCCLFSLMSSLLFSLNEPDLNKLRRTKWSIMQRSDAYFLSDFLF